jgi:hypothetical protein
MWNGVRVGFEVIADLGDAGRGAVMAGLGFELGEALGDDPTLLIDVIERDYHVVRAHGERWGGKIIEAGRGDAFEAAVEVVGEQAGEAALEGGQVGARRDVVLKLVQQRFNVGEGVGSVGGAFEPGERIGGDEGVTAEAGVDGGAVEEDDVREVREALERFDGGERRRERFDEG